MSDNPDIHGFILSEAALYSFKAQDVFPDLLSFCAAIPEHLRPLFLIPIQLDNGESDVPYGSLASIASRVACYTYMDGCHEANSPDAELFSYRTFVYDEDEPLIPGSEPGSIFDMQTGPGKTKHQEDAEEDENEQVPTDTSYWSDVDMTQYWKYPYRTEEEPRHSTIIITTRSAARPSRIALKPEQLEPKTPEIVQERAETCTVNFISYDKRGRVFTFEVDCGNVPRTVRAALSDIDHVALTCSCPNWQYGGPEFHAKENAYLLGPPRGTASPPDIRDPDRKFYLCKHAYAVLARLDHFVERIVEENWDLDDEELLEVIDKEWDQLEPTAQISIEEATETEPEVEEVEEEPEVEEEEVEIEEEEVEEEPEEAEEEVEVPEELEVEETEEEPEEAEEEPEEAEAEEETEEESEAEEEPEPEAESEEEKEE